MCNRASKPCRISNHCKISSTSTKTPKPCRILNRIKTATPAWAKAVWCSPPSNRWRATIQAPQILKIFIIWPSKVHNQMPRMVSATSLSQSCQDCSRPLLLQTLPCQYAWIWTSQTRNHRICSYLSRNTTWRKMTASIWRSKSWLSNSNYNRRMMSSRSSRKATRLCNRSWTNYNKHKQVKQMDLDRIQLLHVIVDFKINHLTRRRLQI